MVPVKTSRGHFGQDDMWRPLIGSYNEEVSVGGTVMVAELMIDHGLCKFEKSTCF